MIPTKAGQNGMTMWGMLMVMALIAFFTILSFKLMPPYIKHAKVKTALENIAKQPDTGTMEKSGIAAALDRRFQIDDVNGVDISKSLTVEKKPSGMSIRIVYEERVPIAYNVTALINFDDTVQVGSR
jgi:hypothetical protein